MSYGVGVSVITSEGTGDVTGPAAATDNDIALFSGVTGKIIKDSGNLWTNVPTMAAVGGAGNLLKTAAANRAISDAAVAVANLATMAANGGAGNIVQTAAADKALSDGGIAVANIPTMAAVGGVQEFLYTAAGNKAIAKSGSTAATFAVAAKGVTNGDTHDHSGGDGAQIDHNGLSNLGKGETETILFIIDGTGSAITTGEKGHLVVDYACTIQSATLLADQSGSIVIDVWVDSYANFPPTVADTITASAKPTLSTAQKSQDTTLTGWTTAIAAGDILAFNCDSCATITRITLALKVVRA